jgi:cobalt/nickel transport system permease protein
MHIPDGFLDTKTVAASAALSVIGLGYALRQIRKTNSARQAPLIGLTAAFIFAAQMLNFPVAGGTSGHLIGATLAVVLLGPFAAILAMSSVLILQCFMFADGGLTALGANIFNMAIVAPICAYVLYQTIIRLLGDNLRSQLTATAFAAWCSTVIASISCAGELAISGTINWGLAFPAMAGVHALIGIGEALITTLVVAAVVRLRPEMLEARTQTQTSFRQILIFGLVISCGLVIFIAPLASSWPDGLERVAENLGFAGKASQTAILKSPLPDYQTPGVSSVDISTIMAGLLGVLVVFALSYILARILTPSPKAIRPQAQE